jgi:NAD-dependent deacetylase sirtuin 2
VIGTSLQVQPFASLIDDVPDHVPRLLINRELAGVHNSKSSGFDFKWKYGLNRDVAFLGDCDEGIEKLVELLGWEKDLQKMHTKGNDKLKAIWKLEQELVDEQQIDKLADELEKLTAEDDKE